MVVSTMNEWMNEWMIFVVIILIFQNCHHFYVFSHMHRSSFSRNHRARSQTLTELSWCRTMKLVVFLLSPPVPFNFSKVYCQLWPDALLRNVYYLFDKLKRAVSTNTRVQDNDPRGGKQIFCISGLSYGYQFSFDWSKELFVHHWGHHHTTHLYLHWYVCWLWMNQKIGKAVVHTKNSIFGHRCLDF